MATRRLLSFAAWQFIVGGACVGLGGMAVALGHTVAIVTLLVGLMGIAVGFADHRIALSQSTRGEE